MHYSAIRFLSASMFDRTLALCCVVKAERLFDARIADLKLKLAESTTSSKRLLKSKQRALKVVT